MNSGDNGASAWRDLKTELGLALRPIHAWPARLRSTYQRGQSPFRAGLPVTLVILKRELYLLGAKGIVLEVSIGEGDLRQDGLPYARAKLSHPGVILSFTTRHGAFRKAYDGFVEWHDNLRALALNLEHLRLANAHGVDPEYKQYGGWAVQAGDNSWRQPQQEQSRAGAGAPGSQGSSSGTGYSKPPPRSSQANKPTPFTAEETKAADFFARKTGFDMRRILTEKDYLENTIRTAQQALHPDRYQTDWQKAAAHEAFILILPNATILRKRFVS